MTITKATTLHITNEFSLGAVFTALYVVLFTVLFAVLYAMIIAPQCKIYRMLEEASS